MHTALTRAEEEKTFNLVGIEPPLEMKAAPRQKTIHYLYIGQRLSKQKEL
jgi:hypothetical protein